MRATIAATTRSVKNAYWDLAYTRENLQAQRQSLDLSKIRPLDSARWAGAVDNLGGEVLAWMASTAKVNGVIACRPQPVCTQNPSHRPEGYIGILLAFRAGGL